MKLPEVKGGDCCVKCPHIRREHEKRIGTYYRCGVNGRMLAYRKRDIILSTDGIQRPAWCTGEEK